MIGGAELRSRRESNRSGQGGPTPRTLSSWRTSRSRSLARPRAPHRRDPPTPRVGRSARMNGPHTRRTSHRSGRGLTGRDATRRCARFQTSGQTVERRLHHDSAAAHSRSRRRLCRGVPSSRPSPRQTWSDAAPHGRDRRMGRFVAAPHGQASCATFHAPRPAHRISRCAGVPDLEPRGPAYTSSTGKDST